MSITLTWLGSLRTNNIQKYMIAIGFILASIILVVILRMFEAEKTTAAYVAAALHILLGAYLWVYIVVTFTML